MTFPTLNLPKRKHSKQKLQLYRTHWKGVTAVREELSRAYIHEKMGIGKVADASQISPGTVKRFFEYGKGHGRYTYSYFHRPAATTLFGIAGALGMELTLRPRKNGKGNGRS